MKGKIILVGAGPGDAGLLTMKGRRELARADAVVYDRLVDREILAMIPENAERIDVGKNVAHHPVPQSEINRILVGKAMEGKRVVRLKGGDCFVFGRGGEELEPAARQGIPFEVVPGITSALAVPAYAGIPATHRDCCSSVHIIAGHRRGDSALEMDYDALVRVRGTLVFLMSVATFGEIADGLMRAGMPSDFPCAIVENGARPEQRKLLTTVGEAAQRVSEGVKSPAVFVVGEVCRLSGALDWYDGLPLKGRRVLTVRGGREEEAVSGLLKDLGARVIRLPGPETERLTAAWTRTPEEILLDGAEAAEALFDALLNAGRDARALNGCRLLCAGEDAAAALKRRGILADGGAEDCGAKPLMLCREDRCGEFARFRPEGTATAAWRRRFPEAETEILPGDRAVLTDAGSAETLFRAVSGDPSAVTAVCIGEEAFAAAEAFGLHAVRCGGNTVTEAEEFLAEQLK